MFGRIQINLLKLIEKEGISKNKFSQRAEMQRTQLNRYCNNNITLLDIDVLARICHTLDCRIEDLLEYIPPTEEPKRHSRPSVSNHVDHKNDEKKKQ